MSVKLPVQKLVVEFRYKPDLGFYGKMDPIALELTDDFPDWERSPLTVEIRNKKRHRRIFLSHNRGFYEADDPDSDAEFGVAEKYLKKICARLSISEFRRFGVRQWLAADLNKPFARMADEVSERFFRKNETVTGILTDKIDDLAYVVNFKTADGWKYNLHLGPMMKSQWFQTLLYEPNLFESAGDKAGETFEKYRATIPEQFLFIDLDCHWEDQPADRLAAILTTARRRTHDLAGKLIDYCKG